MLVAPGEDSPLGLGGAPGEDVGDEGAGIALGLELVEVPVDLRGQAVDVVQGEVGKGLHLNGDQVDLFLRGNDPVGILVVGLAGGPLHQGDLSLLLGGEGGEEIGRPRPAPQRFAISFTAFIKVFSLHQISTGS